MGRNGPVSQAPIVTTITLRARQSFGNLRYRFRDMHHFRKGRCRSMFARSGAFGRPGALLLFQFPMYYFAVFVLLSCFVSNVYVSFLYTLRLQTHFGAWPLFRGVAYAKLRAQPWDSTRSSALGPRLCPRSNRFYRCFPLQCKKSLTLYRCNTRSVTFERLHNRAIRLRSPTKLSAQSNV